MLVVCHAEDGCSGMESPVGRGLNETGLLKGFQGCESTVDLCSRREDGFCAGFCLPRQGSLSLCSFFGLSALSLPGEGLPLQGMSAGIPV